MKAAVVSRYGSPDVVRIAEVSAPSLGDGGVLIKVHATTVNRTDCAYRTATPFFMRAFTGLRRPKRQILGTELAGVVVAVGPAVRDFAVGDRVFGYNEGGFAFGAHAEYAVMSHRGRLAVIPDNVGFREAAAATEGSHYALSFIRTAGIEPGQSVLVYGATGAIGSAAVQLLKSVGATVTAVCDTAHVELVRGLGADRVVDRTVADFTRDTERYDAVFDAVGKSTFGRCRRLLKPTGVYLSSDLGPLWQNLYLPLLTRFSKGRKAKFPLPQESQEMVRHFARLMESGQFRPVIDRTYPLDEIAEAYRYVDTGRKVGNVVIEVVPA